MTISVRAEQPDITLTAFHASDPATDTKEATLDSGFDLRVGSVYLHLSTEEAYRLGTYLKNEPAENSYTPAQILQDAADRIVQRGVPLDEPLGAVLDLDTGETHVGELPAPKPAFPYAKGGPARRLAQGILRSENS